MNQNADNNNNNNNNDSSSSSNNNNKNNNNNNDNNNSVPLLGIDFLLLEVLYREEEEVDQLINLNNSHNSASKMLAEEANNKADAEGAEGDPEVLHRRKELGDDDDGADNGVRF